MKLKKYCLYLDLPLDGNILAITSFVLSRPYNGEFNESFGTRYEEDKDFNHNSCFDRVYTGIDEIENYIFLSDIFVGEE